MNKPARNTSDDMNRLITFLCPLLLFTNLHAQNFIEIHSKRITIGDGIPSNSIRCIYQDSKGFIWFGTLNGLCRYDGTDFVDFQPQPTSGQPSLSDHRIRYIDEDRHGFLWISTAPERYSCYDLKRGRFVDFTGCGEYNQRYSNKIVTGNGDIWLWHKSNGCRKIVYTDQGFASVAFKQELGNLSSDHVNYVYEDSKGRIWIGMDTGIALVTDNDAGQTEAHVVSDVENSYAAQIFGDQVFFLSASGIISVKTTEDEALRDVAHIPNGARQSYTATLCLQDDWYIFTSQGGYVFHTKTHQLEPAGKLNIRNGHVTRDNRGDYWLSNGTGQMWYVDATTCAIKHFRFMPQDKMGYIDRERYNIVHDSRGIVWVSTYGNGLYAYNTHTDELQHFTASTDAPSHIRSNFLLYLIEDKNQNIWISSEYAGVSQLTVLNENIQNILPDNESRSEHANIIRMVTQLPRNGCTYISTRNGYLYTYDENLEKQSETHFEHSNIYAVTEDHEGKLWMGSRGRGLCIDGTWYVNQKNNPNSLSFNHIFSLYCDSQGRVWIGTFGGGLNLATKQADGAYTFSQFLNKSYDQRYIRSIIEDRQGWMWIGTNDGIYVFHPDSLFADPTNYIEYSNRTNHLKNNEIKCIYEDKQGNIWIGTSGKGISQCKPNGNYRNVTFNHYNTNDGLINDMIQSIIEDLDGNLWIATEYGISCFNPKNQTFQNFLFSAYELSNVFCENSACLLTDGRILLGSNYGLIAFDPEKVYSRYRTKLYANVTLTTLRINGIETHPDMQGSPLTKDIAYTNDITLKHYQNSLILNFSTFNYSDKDKTNYTYKLDNYDSEWNPPSLLNFAIYRNLPPGKYIFRVKACNGTATDLSQETCLNITIKPPFYKTTMAYVVYLLILIITVYLLFRLAQKLNVLRNRIAIEKQLTEYKLAFFTNISHEFRTPLTLILATLEKIESYPKIPKEIGHSLKIMDKNTRRLLKLINQLLEFRKIQNNKLTLSLEETDVVTFVYEIFLIFKDVSELKDIDFRYLPSVESYHLYIDKENLDKVIYNLLSNAFKYTPHHGKIFLAINFDEEHRQLIISVTDTGVGVPKEKQTDLFTYFTKSDFSTNSMGIGLYLSNELVKVHKGTLSYQPNEGGGSIFIVTLPIDPSVYEEQDFLKPNQVTVTKQSDVIEQEQPIDEATDSIDLPKLSDPINKRKVLIIEDNPDVREFLSQEIGKYFTVKTEADGKSGLKQTYAFEPDLIICDVLMPEINGFEVTRKLKSNFNTSHIPIILLTALDSPEKKLEGMQNGADMHINKPFSLNYLITCVMKLIEQRDKLKEKFSNDPTTKTQMLCSSEHDQKFANELQSYIEQHLADPNLSINDLITAMKLGRTVFYHKVRGVTGYSPNKYIRIIRLKKAAELLKTKTYNVSEVCYKVGFNDPFYFSQCFKQLFGVSPSVYQRTTQEAE